MDRSVLGENVQKINLLTVIASESYAGFVDDLQKETEAELRERPKKATPSYFAGRTVHADGKSTKLSEDQALEIYTYLVQNAYVDSHAGVTEVYRSAAEYAPLPEDLKPFEAEIHRLVRAIYDPSQLAALYSDGNETKINENPLNERFYKEEFQKLWSAINHKYAYCPHRQRALCEPPTVYGHRGQSGGANYSGSGKRRQQLFRGKIAHRNASDRTAEHPSL